MLCYVYNWECIVVDVWSSNGYSLFTIETLPLISHLPNNERLGEVSRRWKKLSEDKKEAYNLKAEEVNSVIEEISAAMRYKFVDRLAQLAERRS